MRYGFAFPGKTLQVVLINDPGKILFPVFSKMQIYLFPSDSNTNYCALHPANFSY